MDLELDELDLEECIGRGGHGAVYKVRPMALRRTVCLRAACGAVHVSVVAMWHGTSGAARCSP